MATVKGDVHDIGKNISREVTFEEAQKLKLNPAVTSADGFTVTTGESDYSIFSIFFSRGGRYGDRYLSGHGVTKRLALYDDLDKRYYYGNFDFIGWIED